MLPGALAKVKEFRIGANPLATSAEGKCREENGAVLLLNATEEEIQCTLEDDGVGFDPARAGSQNGLGLAAMEERIKKLGGKLSVQSSPGRGTTVIFTVPQTTTGAAAKPLKEDSSVSR